jgi:hypothetical protein
MDDLGQRQARAAERILGDERLTDNLDDEAAQVLLDWGLTCAEEVVRQGSSTEGEAGEGISHRLRAVRRMMRRVNDWAPRCSEMTADQGADSLAQVIEQAEIFFDFDFPPPDDAYWSDLLDYCDEQNATPTQLISLLRTLVMGYSGWTETEPNG